ncbi:hypothetical protein SDC9_208271 [bioreactor metagenome]|uniref:Uncharacterized protein n=1 Tax=bioreactor metagenome TaxID=1076179 RepID=A0A645JLN8_9ZZZZ
MNRIHGHGKILVGGGEHESRCVHRHAEESDPLIVVQGDLRFDGDAAPGRFRHSKIAYIPGHRGSHEVHEIVDVAEVHPSTALGSHGQQVHVVSHTGVGGRGSRGNVGYAHA